MPSATQIDEIIKRNLRLFQKAGVTSIRPGYKARGGRLTHEPAIVVSVREKKRTVPPEQLLPAVVDGVQVDVRQVSPIEALRTTDPHQFAQVMANVPVGNEPAYMQTPTFPLERDPQGKLVTDKLSDAEPTRGRKASGPHYQKLSASMLAEIQGPFKITCFASPDDGWPTLKQFLSGATKTLTVGMYEFTAPHIVQTVSVALKGKTLNLVLDDPRYDQEKREQTESQTQQQLESAIGKKFNFSWAAEGSDPHSSFSIFPSAYHIKVAIRDSSALWLSSGNLNSTNLPNIVPLTNPADAATAADADRDWHVIIENEQLASVFETAVLQDLAQAQPGQQTAASTPGTRSDRPKGAPISHFEAAQSFNENMSIQPAFTPDNYIDVILPLIKGAKQSFWMQTQYINPSKHFPDDVKKPVTERSNLEQLIDALANLQKNGLDVKILLGSFQTTSQLEMLQMFGNIDATTIRLQENVHNKGMIIDSVITVIGSQNWSTEGVDTNRDASVVIKSSSVAQYWKNLFLLDWNTRSRAPELPAK